MCELADPYKLVESYYCFIKNYSRNSSMISLGFAGRKPFDNIIVCIFVKVGVQTVQQNSITSSLNWKYRTRFWTISDK